MSGGLSVDTRGGPTDGTSGDSVSGRAVIGNTNFNIGGNPNLTANKWILPALILAGLVLLRKWIK